MTMRPRSAPRVWRAAAVLAALACAACSETRYVPIQPEDAAERQALPLDRVVEFDRREELLTDPPACVLVLPPAAQDKNMTVQLAALIEEAATRHLSVRARRVIAGSYRDQQARYHGVVLRDSRSAAPLARALGCDTVIELRVTEADAAYAIFFASYRMALDLRLTRVRDGVELWRGRHLSQRMAGGVPISLGAPVAAASAAALASDGEAVHALVDEILRRLFSTWPAARRLG